MATSSSVRANELTAMASPAPKAEASQPRVRTSWKRGGRTRHTSTEAKKRTKSSKLIQKVPASSRSTPRAARASGVQSDDLGPQAPDHWDTPEGLRSLTMRTVSPPPPSTSVSSSTPYACGAWRPISRARRSTHAAPMTKPDALRERSPRKSSSVSAYSRSAISSSRCLSRAVRCSGVRLARASARAGSAAASSRSRSSRDRYRKSRMRSVA
mmetsp:Transcript_22363/g.60448  ORF Transcript_22363/g.60448 Transcript_22363/m.60448 type:complete len:212 (+) Transcript_22363:1296-1931(+)